MENTRFEIINRDYLPVGITWEDIKLALERKATLLTAESLKEIVSASYLEQLEELFGEYCSE